MNAELRVLILEDESSDAELVKDALQEAGLSFTSMRVEKQAEFVSALTEFRPDVVLADVKLPHFNGREALKIVRQTHPEVAVIMVTGTVGDEAAVELLKEGARDYVLKDRLARLGPAVKRALSEERGIRARKAAEKALRESEERFRCICAAAQDAIIMIDSHGCISYWNGAAERQFGYPAAEANGRSLHELIAPERYRLAARRGLEGFAQTGTGPMVSQVTELTAMRRGGTEFEAEQSISPVRIGDHWHAIGIVRDITDRKKAQRKQEAQLDELRRFQEVTVGRELRMKELRDENERLKEELKVRGPS